MLLGGGELGFVHNFRTLPFKNKREGGDVVRNGGNLTMT